MAEWVSGGGRSSGGRVLALGLAPGKTEGVRGTMQRGSKVPSGRSAVALDATSARPRLDGARLSPTTLSLIACGTLGGVLFTMVYLIEGATRPGYVAWQQAISALSLGPGGWVQQVNFVVFGLLTICSLFGWRRALAPGPAAVWYPILKGVSGVGLIMDGVFSQDPVPGYPVGATLGAPTTHAVVHTLFAVVAITAIALGDFVLARRFAWEPRWRAWMLPAVVTGVLTIVFIALFGASGAHGGIAGIYERLSTGVNSLLSIAILARLVAQRRGERAAADTRATLRRLAAARQSRADT